MDYTGQGHFGGGFPRAPGRESGSSSRFMGPYAPQHSITTFPPESSSSAQQQQQMPYQQFHYQQQHQYQRQGQHQNWHHQNQYQPRYQQVDVRNQESAHSSAQSSPPTPLQHYPHNPELQQRDFVSHIAIEAEHLRSMAEEVGARLFISSGQPHPAVAEPHTEWPSSPITQTHPGNTPGWATNPLMLDAKHASGGSYESGYRHSPNAGEERFHSPTTGWLELPCQISTASRPAPHRDNQSPRTPPPVSPSDISINSAGAASNTTPSKAYTCQYCAKSVKVLSRHIQDVHRDRLVNPPGLYPCLVDGCPRVEDAFKRRDNRTQHLRTVHGLDIEKQKPGRVGKSSPRSNLDDEQWPRPGEGWASEVEERRGGYGDAL